MANTETPSAHRPMTALEWGLLVTVGTLWGMAYVLLGIAVKEWPPFTVMLARLTLAVPLLFVVLSWRGGRLPPMGKPMAWCLLVGVFTSLAPLSMIVWAQQYIPAGVAAIIGATTPMATVFVAHAMTQDEKIGARRLAGAIIGFVGVAVMIGLEIRRQDGLGRYVVGEIACVAAAITFAFGTVFLRRFRTLGIEPMAGATASLGCSWLLLLPLSAAFDKPWTLPTPSWQAIAAMIGAGLFSSALANLLFTRLLSTASANNAALVTLLQPVSAILLAALVLGERLEPRHVVGMLIIVLAFGIIDGRPLAALARLRR